MEAGPFLSALDNPFVHDLFKKYYKKSPILINKNSVLGV